MNFESTASDAALAQSGAPEKAIAAMLERNPRFHVRRVATPIPLPSDRRHINRFKFAHLAKALPCSLVARFREENRSILTHLKNTTNDTARL